MNKIRVRDGGSGVGHLSLTFRKEKPHLPVLAASRKSKLGKEEGGDSFLPEKNLS